LKLDRGTELGPRMALGRSLEAFLLPFAPNIKKPRAPLFLFDVEFRELFLEMLNLGQVVDHDVQVFGMIVGVILVVILCGIERV
jgi:hypothetical protein